MSKSTQSVNEVDSSRVGDKTPDLQEMHALAALFNQGRYSEVEPQARAMTENFPQHGFGWKLLGAVCQNLGLVEESLKAKKLSVTMLPDDEDALNNLGNTLRELGRFSEAETILRRSLLIKPKSAMARNNLGLTLQQLGDGSKAEVYFREALEIRKDYAAAHCNLGDTLQEQNRYAEAVSSYRCALAIKPGYAEAYNNLGVALKELGQYSKAELSFQRALGINSELGETYNNLGIALKEQGLHSGAETCYRLALEMKPIFAEALNNLGVVLKELGHLGEAEACCCGALGIKPDYADAYNNLGNILQDLGRLDEAEACLRRARQISSDFAEAYSNLLFTLNYHPDKTGEEIYAAYREYDAWHGLPQRGSWREHDNCRETKRRVRVGYVSPDFRYHSVRHFLEPLLSHHDKGVVEVFAYAELTREDEVTQRYKGYVEHWIPTVGMTDTALAERIREDGIDILVDLAGHTAKNRLGVFARKPAPVAVTWLGYGYTTGLTAIDYILTDATCTPMGSEGLFSETPQRIAAPNYAYRPAEGMGEVNALPAMQKGYVTFGTLTRSVRINHRTIRVWSAILKRVEGSRLVMDNKGFQDEGLRRSLEAQFATHGIEAGRLLIGYHSPPWDQLREMDIGLDCFPHNSGTTLFETLYMGIPFVTLAGRPSVGRLGSTILEGVGHPEWIAKTEEEYMEKVVALATDLPMLKQQRTELRAEMEASLLMDEVGFARRVEAAYREMFAIWANRRVPE